MGAWLPLRRPGHCWSEWFWNETGSFLKEKRRFIEKAHLVISGIKTNRSSMEMPALEGDRESKWRGGFFLLTNNNGLVLLVLTNINGSSMECQDFWEWCREWPAIGLLTSVSWRETIDCSEGGNNHVNTNSRSHKTLCPSCDVSHT